LKKKRNYKFIPTKNAQRRFVIADIHGCSKTFKALVQDKIKLKKTDQLFLLGDYINRGPDSSGVIDFILELKANNFQVFTLRGNHEQMLLDSHRQNTNYPNQEYLKLPRLQKRKDLVSNLGIILPQYVDFFENLYHYFELDNFFLVHAGFDFTKPNPFENYESMLWIRNFEPDNEYLQNNPKRIIHGHTIHWFQDIKQAIENKEEVVIPLDNGCYEGLKEIHNPYTGNLCALDLDCWELIIQENIEIHHK